MNIEEERKAFEEKGYSHEGIAKCLIFADGKYSVISKWQCRWTQHLCDNVNRLFPVWLAAKAHAAEMAKPTVFVSENLAGNYGVYKPDAIRPIATYESFADALKYAKDNGYRVIE